MYEKCFHVVLVAIICLVCFGVPASAASISYQYIYDTRDGQGAEAVQPSATSSDKQADSLHDPSYTTYSTGELNDGYSVPEGAWDAGESYPDSWNRYNFWDSNGGHQVGVNDWSRVKPSIVVKFDGPCDLSLISVNYEVLLVNGICAPGPSVDVYFGVENGGTTSWSSSTLRMWNLTNPANETGPWDGLAHSNIWLYTADVTDMPNSSEARYVRLDITSNSEWVSLIEVSFDGTAVPEPSTLALLSAGLIGLLCYAWRKRRQ